MRVLLLSPYPEKLLQVFEGRGDTIVATENLVTADYLQEEKFDIGVSYGYQHILKRDVLDLLSFINLHISYLPWNRGADPNIWSWMDGTIKGVTIHYIDEGIDTGDIIVQQEVAMGPDETLATSYQKLQAAIEQLFSETWPLICSGTALRFMQKDGGSLHYVKDRKKIESLLMQGYDTPCKYINQQS